MNEQTATPDIPTTGVVKFSAADKALSNILNLLVWYILFLFPGVIFAFYRWVLAGGGIG